LQPLVIMRRTRLLDYLCTAITFFRKSTKGTRKMFNFEEANKKNKEVMDTALKGYSEVAKGFQAIAAETSEYSKKSFQDAVTHMETLAGAKSFETVFELQSGFVKSYYEG